MVTVNKDKSFKCSHGELFSTLEDAIMCDLNQMIRNEIKDDVSIFSFYEMAQKKVIDSIPREVLEMIISQETKIILYWILKNSNLLENMITFVLDTKVHFEKLEAGNGN